MNRVLSRRHAHRRTQELQGSIHLNGDWLWTFDCFHLVEINITIVSRLTIVLQINQSSHQSSVISGRTLNVMKSRLFWRSSQVIQV